MRTLVPLMCVLASLIAFGQEEPPLSEPPPVVAQPAEIVSAAPPPDTADDIRQVQIQIWISQTDEDGLRELGTNLNYTRFVRGNEQSGSVERIETNTFDIFDTNPTDNRPQTFETTLPAPDSNPFPDNVRLSPDTANVFAPSGNTLVARPNRPGEFNVNTYRGVGLSWSIIDADRGTLDGIFRGIETKTDSDLISKPEILVMNENTASIQAGEEFPYQKVVYDGGNPQLSVDWKRIGVNLELKPTILSDEDLVQIDITNLKSSTGCGIRRWRVLRCRCFRRGRRTVRCWCRTGRRWSWAGCRAVWSVRRNGVCRSSGDCLWWEFHFAGAKPRRFSRTS
jgi:hypothetical protein